MSVALLPNQLSNGQLQARAAWGADLTADDATWTWSDITTDVLQAGNNGISITMGRLNEFGTAAPAQCTLRLKNPTGTYTPENPGSANYPNVRVGTPIQVRVSLDGGATWAVRFQGEAASWAPKWDAQGKFAYAVVTANGITRRLGSGNKPLRSPLTRSIMNTTTPVLQQYWPCEDLNNSTQAASVTGGPPLRVSGTVRFASMDYLNQTDFTVLPNTTFGTLPLPQLKEGGSLSATFSGGSSSAWTVQAAIFCNPVSDNTQVVLFQWVDATGRVWQVTSDGITTDSVSLLVNGSVIASEPHIMINEDVRIDVAQSGGSINWSFKPMLSHPAITGSFAGTLGAVSSFTANPNGTVTTGSLSVGHVRVWDDNTAPDFKTSTQAVSAWNGYPGETADTRMARLCAEEGIALAITGTSSATMGTQGVDTFMNLLRECEATDLGILLDGLSQGLTYICRTSLTNQPVVVTLDANSGHIPANATPQPVSDDQKLRNRITVTNKDGSSAIAEDTDGTRGTTTAGVFDDARSVNLNNDSTLDNIAWWLLHFGTNAGMRYPSLTIDFTASPELATAWVGTIPTDRFNVENLDVKLTQLAPADFALRGEGWIEFLAGRRWFAAVNFSNYEPWDFASLNGLFRLEMAGQTLAANLTSGATSLSLATASGHALFTTTAKYPADFPLILNVAGWPITVTAASGSSSPQTLTISASPNTSTIPSGTAVTLWQPTGVLAL